VKARVIVLVEVYLALRELYAICAFGLADQDLMDDAAFTAPMRIELIFAPGIMHVEKKVSGIHASWITHTSQQ